MSNTIAVISLVVITISCLVMLYYVYKLTKARISCFDRECSLEKAISLFNHIDSLIRTHVTSLNQTLVDKLKNTESFTQLDKDEAFESCRENIYKCLTGYDTNILKPYVNDIHEWIKNRIEYYVKILK